MILWYLITSLITLNIHHLNMPNQKETKEKKPSRNSQFPALYPAVYSCKRPCKKRFVLLFNACNITWVESSLTQLSHHQKPISNSTKNPLKLSYCTPNSCLSNQLWASNSKLISNLLIILFFLKIFPTLTS